MDRKWKLGLGLACALGIGNFARAAESYSISSYEQTLAPTVVQASCTSCESGGCDTNACDTLGCSCGLLGGLAGCDGGCDSGCGCGSDCGLLGYGIVKKSDTCFNDFISPMTNPVYFEDPRNLTEARAIFLNHNLPAALGGNSVQVYALQIRAALTKRLSLIATKDGLIYTQSPVLNSGIADINVGLKYNLFADVCSGRLLSVGTTFEAPTGSNRSLQGNGNGVFNFFASYGTRVGSCSHWVSTAGMLEPLDTNLENRMLYWSNWLRPSPRIGSCMI
ncbi:MAG: hypothetical protein KDB03_01790 [Planctomycetales bacterium]|nr:hypothetical protein [Planctomycetales bacterium]